MPLAEYPIESLSLGKGRLVELARALMCQPQLLFLDEPSSGLDIAETHEMATVLETVQRDQGTAILLVEHDVPLVERLASRTYVLDVGGCSRRARPVRCSPMPTSAPPTSARGLTCPEMPPT